MAQPLRWHFLATFCYTPAIGYSAGIVLGKLMGDVLITWDDIFGLMDNTFSSSSRDCNARRSGGTPRAIGDGRG